MITDRASSYLRILDELIPSAQHTTEQYANNRVETADAGPDPRPTPAVTDQE